MKASWKSAWIAECMVNELAEAEWLLQKKKVWVLGKAEMNFVLLKVFQKKGIDAEWCAQRRDLEKLLKKGTVQKVERAPFFLIVSRKYEEWKDVLEQFGYCRKDFLWFPLYMMGC